MWEIEKIHELKGHAGAIYDFCVSGFDLYSGGSDGVIVKWDTKTGNGVVFAQTENPIYNIYFQPNSSFLYSGNLNGKLFQFDTYKKSIVNQLDLKESIFSILFTSLNNLYIGTEKGIIYKLDNTDFSIKKILKYSKKSVRKMIVFENNILVGYSDFSIKKINLENDEILQEWQAHENSVFALETFQKKLFSGGRDAMLKSWNLDRNPPEIIQNIPAHLGHIKDIKLHPNKLIFATSSMDKSIKIWDANTFELLKVIDQKFIGHTSSINQIYWIDETTLASCSDDRKLIIWSIKNT